MRNLTVALLFILFSAYSFGQNYIPLKDALKKPSGTDEIIISPNEDGRIHKFIKRIDRFDDLQTLYLQRGFTANDLRELVAGLKNTELAEMIVECDTLTQLVRILAGLEATDKITLIEPFVMKPDALEDISKLNCGSLCLKSSGRIKIPRDFAFPKNLEEIEILSKQPSRNYLLVDKLAGLEKLTSVYITTDELASLPVGLGNIPHLKNLEIIKAKELDNEAELMAKRFRVAKEAYECSKLISITYNTSEDLNPEEKQVFSTIFDGFYFVNGNEPEEAAVSEFETPIAPEVFKELTGFKPLVENVDVQRKPFKVDAQTPVQIEVSTGTVINIPKNAFVDADGKPVTGNVKVTYREIKTPLEMLRSGVPMAYDSGGVLNQFVSAGNFEILAFQEGKPLGLGEGKNIDISFVSTDEEAGFNLYKLNPETRNWEFEGSADNKNKPETDTTDNEKPLVIKDLSFDYGFDTTAYENRYASLDYRYMLDANETKGIVTEVTRTKRHYTFRYPVVKKVNTKFPLVKIRIDYTDKVKKDSTHQVKFKLIPKVNKKDNIKFFTEMSAFMNFNFYTEEETTRKLFRDLYVKKDKYFDVRILYENGDNHCIIQLKTANGYREITADITQGQEGRTAVIRKRSFARRYKRYTRYLNKRIERLNNGLDQRKRATRNGYNEGSVSAAVTRQLSLKGFGVFNCDRFMTYDQVPTVITKVMIKTNDSTIIEPLTLFVVDTKINGLFTYLPQSMSYYKKSTKTIIAVDMDENLYCIDGDVNNAIEKNTIRMKAMDLESLRTSKEFAKRLGL